MTEDVQDEGSGLAAWLYPAAPQLQADIQLVLKDIETLREQLELVGTPPQLQEERADIQECELQYYMACTANTKAAIQHIQDQEYEQAGAALRQAETSLLYWKQDTAAAGAVAFLRCKIGVLNAYAYLHKRQHQEHATVRYLYEARALETSILTSCARNPFPGEAGDRDEMPTLAEALRETECEDDGTLTSEGQQELSVVTLDVVASILGAPKENPEKTLLEDGIGDIISTGLIEPDTAVKDSWIGVCTLLAQTRLNLASTFCSLSRTREALHHAITALTFVKASLRPQCWIHPGAAQELLRFGRASDFPEAQFYIRCTLRQILSRVFFQEWAAAVVASFLQIGLALRQIQNPKAISLSTTALVAASLVGKSCLPVEHVLLVNVKKHLDGALASSEIPERVSGKLERDKLCSETGECSVRLHSAEKHHGNNFYEADDRNRIAENGGPSADESSADGLSSSGDPARESKDPVRFSIIQVTNGSVNGSRSPKPAGTNEDPVPPAHIRKPVSRRGMGFPNIGRSVRSSPPHHREARKKEASPGPRELTPVFDRGIDLAILQLKSRHRAVQGELDCLSVDDVKELRHHHSAFARRLCEQKRREHLGASGKKTGSSEVSNDTAAGLPKTHHCLEFPHTKAADSLRELIIKLKNIGIDVEAATDYAALDFSTAFSHSTGFIYDSPVTSAAALAGSPTGPREGGVPSVVPTSDASAATSKAVDSGNTDGSLFGKSDSIPGDSRGYPPVGSVGFALSNDGSFTDWLKSIEVYHLIEHVLNKDYDCWDFNNKKIEGLLLLKALYHRFLCEKQEIRRRELIPKEKGKESRVHSPLARKGKYGGGRRNKRASIAAAEEKDEMEEISLAAFAV